MDTTKHIYYICTYEVVSTVLALSTVSPWGRTREWGRRTRWLTYYDQFFSKSIHIGYTELLIKGKEYFTNAFNCVHIALHSLDNDSNNNNQ